jgi:hypothetical protein
MSVFILAFFLNWAWEILHSALYLNYQGGPVTSFILFRAALADAAIILILIFAAQKLKLNGSIFVILGGLVISIGIEIWSLQTGRWTYDSLMPIIPIIKTGLTPTVQLAAIGYVVQKAIFCVKSKA